MTLSPGMRCCGRSCRLAPWFDGERPRWIIATAVRSLRQHGTTRTFLRCRHLAWLEHRPVGQAPAPSALAGSHESLSSCPTRAVAERVLPPPVAQGEAASRAGCEAMPTASALGELTWKITVVMRRRAEWAAAVTRADSPRRSLGRTSQHLRAGVRISGKTWRWRFSFSMAGRNRGRSDLSPRWRDRRQDNSRRKSCSSRSFSLG